MNVFCPRICRLMSRRFHKMDAVNKGEKIVKVPRLTRGVLSGCIKIGKEVIQKGGVVATPTDTIYGIAGSAQNTEAIHRMYNIKNRNSANPLAICVGDIEDVFRWCDVCVGSEILSDLLPGPVTLLFERTKALNRQLNPDTFLVGVRIPDQPFIRGLARAAGPLALTSANISSLQSTLDVSEFQDLWPKLDLIFDSGRIMDSMESRLGSTVVDLSKSGEFKIVRKGCAYDATVKVLKEKHGLQERSS